MSTQRTEFLRVLRGTYARACNLQLATCTRLKTASPRFSHVSFLFWAKKRRFWRIPVYDGVRISHPPPSWADFFSMLDISTVRVVLVPEKSPLGNIPPRPFRIRVIRYWRPLGCRVVALGKPPQGWCMMYAVICGKVSEIIDASPKKRFFKKNNES